MFFDTPSRVIFEVDYENSGEVKVVCETDSVNVYQIENENSYKITREFLSAIGRCYIPPLWAFGYPNDEWERGIDDQLLVGGSIMMTPILEEGATTRKVYLPEDMTMVKYNGKEYELYADDGMTKEYSFKNVKTLQKQ